MAKPAWLLSLASTSRVKARSSQPLALCSKILLYTILVGWTILALAVGPASAMLFAPAQFWIKASSTHFYIGGREDTLWPATLTSNHTGPEICHQSPLRMEFTSCLYGSWRVLLGAVTMLRPVRPGFSFFIPGGGAYEHPSPALICGNIPAPENDFGPGDPDTWAVAPDLGVASHMGYLTEQTNHAFNFAQGWKKRLRDIGGSRVVLTTDGKFPVVRTLCMERTSLSTPPTRLDIPLLNEDKFWRERVKNSSGPTFSFSLKDPSLADWDALQINTATFQQSRAKWIPMPENTGAGSAVMIHLLQSATVTDVVTCVVDARWATGQTMQSDRSVMWSWESQPGLQPFDPPSSPQDWAFHRVSMFDPRYASNYSKPIAVEQAWLDALAPPMPEASMLGNKLIMNSFEAILNQSGLKKADEKGDQIETVKLEYVHP
jgi:hypothetical protein